MPFRYLLSALLLACCVATSASAQATQPSQAYVFAYFKNNGEDGLHLASSHDGYVWQTLNDDQSYLQPMSGTSNLMRDPCIIHCPDGLFRMVFTDSWTSDTIGYASSKDLMHWTDERAIPVMANFPNTSNCWAPVVIYDDQKHDYLIFWASTIPGAYPETLGKAEQKNNHRIYSTTTTDFVHFTPARVFFDPGYIVIDAMMLKADGKYCLIFKDETLTPVHKYLQTAWADSCEGPFTQVNPPFTPQWVEGPTGVKAGDQYLLYFDVYRAHHYGLMISPDLKTWTDATAKLQFPRGARHGTVMALPGEVVDGLSTATTRPAQ